MFKTNTQEPEHKRDGDGQNLDVHSIFHTIQGEGPFSGRPAIFIRLAGCNLQCPGCDTEYTKTRHTHSLERVFEILKHTRWQESKNTTSLVVITGGEPFRQNITPLAKGLIDFGWDVQIETNGTLAPSSGFPAGVTIVCSPKAGRVNDALMRRVDAYKYVLDAASIDPIDGLPNSVLGNPVRPARPPQGFMGVVYVSPMDTSDAQRNEFNVFAAAQTCLKYGHTLNLQVHKLVNLP